MPSDRLKQALATRELAKQAQHLDNGLSETVDKDRLLLHAEELEDLATELERPMVPKTWNLIRVCRL